MKKVLFGFIPSMMSLFWDLIGLRHAPHGIRETSKLRAVKKRGPWIAWLSFCVLLVSCDASEAKTIHPAKLDGNNSYAHHENQLEKGFSNPPHSARPIPYWWWLDGNISKEGITADLEAFQSKGLGGVILFDSTHFRDKIPTGKFRFMTPEWIEMFKHTVSEANRLGLTVSLNPASGYCYGGSWAGPEDGFQSMFWVETKLKGPAKYMGNAFSSEGKNRLLTEKAGRLVAVLAIPDLPAGSKPAQVRDWEFKAGYADVHRGWKKYFNKNFLECDPPEPNELAVAEGQTINLTVRSDASGNLSWEVPKGEWTLLGLGHSFNGAKMYIPSKVAQSGPHADYLNPKVTEKGFTAVVNALAKVLSPESRDAFRYIHEDSLEVHTFNWTGGFLGDFCSRRGYDPTPYLPIMAGRIVGSSEIANRFLYDLRKTIGDMVADHHYGQLTSLAHQKGMETHLQAGGPHLLMTDPLKCLGRADIPMGEFWVMSPQRPTDDGRFYIKLASSAAHIYGKRRVLCESFSAMGQLLWKDGPYELKQVLDRAFCEGVNWIAPMEAGARADLTKIPGDVTGSTPFSPTLTYWKQADGWFSYMSRCSYMLQQGVFVGDLLYYYGDQVPNQLPRRKLDPARGLGYDYDAINAEAILERLQVRDGLLVLPDGLSYRLLVLPDRTEMPLEIAQKLKQLVEAGAIVIGPRPGKDPGLRNYPSCDAEVQRIGLELWGDCDGKTVKEHAFGKGKVFWGMSPKETLAKLTIPPDFTYETQTVAPSKWPMTEPLVDFIHRRDGNTDLYFVVNRTSLSMVAKCQFRVSGKHPELWNPVTAKIQDAGVFKQADGITSVPLELAPYESVFVVFRRRITNEVAVMETLQEPVRQTLETLSGPWTVSFDPAWGPFTSTLAQDKRPGELIFDELVDWTKHSNEAVKYYSGTATYKKDFSLPNGATIAGQRIWIDLGDDVRNVAEVRVNGKLAGTLWCPPWKVELSDMVSAGVNRLEIDVVNLWTNRLIGDSVLPEEKRYTRTNGRTNGSHGNAQGTYSRETPLFPSGLLGPVKIVTQKP